MMRLLLFGALGAATCAGAATSPPSSSMPAWAEAMQRDGYIVQEGMYGYLGPKECLRMDTCLALNPATPYGLIYLPSHPFEGAEKSINYTNSCVKHSLCKTVGKATWSPMWRVARGEAIILTGLTPPNSTYWSFENYLWSRLQPRGFRPKPQDLTHRLLSCPRVPWWSKGKRCDLFAGINDPMNLKTVNASNPFNSPITVVIAWDQETEAAASRYLAPHSNANGPMNYLRFPGAIFKLGVTRGDEDEFFNMLRVEGIRDEAARKAFYEHVPLRAFRVTPTVQIPTPSDTALWPSFDGHLRTRWTGHSESAPGVTTEALRDGLRQLQTAILKKHSRSFFDHTALPFKAWVNDSGYECIARGIRCQGDCRDTVYAYATLVNQEKLCNATHVPCKPARKAELTFHPSDAIYVFGVNHRRTDHATYASLTMYDFPRLASASIRIMGKEMEQFTVRDIDYENSAVDLLPKHQAAPFLYVVKYTRKCQAREEVLCVEVPIKSQNPEAILMPVDADLAFIERMYLKPGGKTGPALAETVLPSMVHIRRIFEDNILV